MTQTNKQILSVVSGNSIPYSFKIITYRQFRKAIALLEDSRLVKGDEQDRIVDEAAAILIEGSALLLDEASNVDVQSVMESAIEFNQGTEADAKKSA